MSQNASIVKKLDNRRVVSRIDMVSVWFSWLHNHVKDSWLVICLGDDHYTQKVIDKEAACCQSAVSKHTRGHFNETGNAQYNCAQLRGYWQPSEYREKKPIQQCVGWGGIGDGLGSQIIVFHQVRSQCSFLPGDFRELYASSCWLALWKCWFYLSTVATVPKLVAGLTGQQTHPN